MTILAKVYNIAISEASKTHTGGKMQAKYCIIF
jgi:hypothetical protein